MIRPVAGEDIASRCASVIRGSKNPLLVLFTSSIADAAALVPSVLMATWAVRLKHEIIIIATKNNLSFFILVHLVNIIVVRYFYVGQRIFIINVEISELILM